MKKKAIIGLQAFLIKLLLLTLAGGYYYLHAVEEDKTALMIENTRLSKEKLQLLLQRETQQDTIQMLYTQLGWVKKTWEAMENAYLARIEELKQNIEAQKEVIDNQQYREDKRVAAAQSEVYYDMKKLTDSLFIVVDQFQADNHFLRTQQEQLQQKLIGKETALETFELSFPGRRLNSQVKGMIVEPVFTLRTGIVTFVGLMALALALSVVILTFKFGRKKLRR